MQVTPCTVLPWEEFHGGTKAKSHEVLGGVVLFVLMYIGDPPSRSNKPAMACL